MGLVFQVVSGFRAMSTWRLRPYAAAGAAGAAMPLASLSAGYSKAFPCHLLKAFLP